MTYFAPSSSLNPATLAVYVVPTTPKVGGENIFFGSNIYSYIGKASYFVAKPSSTNEVYPVKTVPTESAVIASLNPSKRWGFIAKNHPFEFLISLISIILSCFIAIHIFWDAFIYLGASIISTALADTSKTTVANIFSTINLQWFVALLFSALLIWAFGMVTWAKEESKIAFARDCSKQFTGFLIGWATGTAGKSA